MQIRSTILHQDVLCHSVKPTSVARSSVSAKPAVCQARQAEAVSLSRRNLAALVAASPLLLVAQRGMHMT